MQSALTPLTRRSFLRHAASAGAAVTLADRAAALARRAGMFVSLNASMTRHVEWPEFARLAARVGYGGVDVNLDAARAQGVEATRALFAELKIRPGVINLPFRLGSDEPAFEEGLKALEGVAGFAAAIGCPRMMAVMPPASATPKVELQKTFKDRLTAISAVLRPSDVRLGLEFLGPLHFRTRQPHEFIWRMNELLEFTKECGPNIGLVLDAWHWHHAGATGDDILNAGKSRIVHVHVSDAKPQPPEEVRDNQRLMPGEGVIELTAFFRCLQQIGYTDAVSPEPIGRVPATMPAEDGARLGLQTTRDAMKKAGIAPA
jgi:sugar phosphate isomerase/epimerase